MAISKRITLHPSTRTKPGNHHYCFVDMASLEGAKAAAKALDGKFVTSGRLLVRLAGELPDKLNPRLTRTPDAGSVEEAKEQPDRELARKGGGLVSGTELRQTDISRPLYTTWIYLWIYLWIFLFSFLPPSPAESLVNQAKG